MTSAPEISGLLRSARRRLVAQNLFRRLGQALLAAGALLIVVAVAEEWRDLRGWRAALYIALPALVIVLPLFVAALRFPGLPRLAQLLDDRGRTHDRIGAALAFTAQPADGMRALAVRECAVYLRGLDFRALLPWLLPLEWRWLAVPMVALGLLHWDLRIAAEVRAGRLAAAQEAVAPTVEALRSLAREIDSAAKKTRDPELRKMAEELARRAENLRSAATGREAAERARLREISALEQLAQEMRSSASIQISPEELKAVAAVLQKQEATRAAAEKMKSGDAKGAAEELERLAQKAAGGNDSSAAQAAAELREALNRLAAQKQISDTLRQQLSPAPGSPAEAALRQLADLLRKLPPAPGGKPGGPSSPQSLQNLLAALQNLKFGQRPPSGKNSAPGNAPGQLVQISPPSASPANSPAGELSTPGANPSTENDTGTTDSPFGKDRQEAANKGADLALQGEQTDEGASASQSLPGGAEAARSSRRYKEQYRALAPAAESAVLQEEIPLGSRLFIKRYFESIRPAE